MLQVDGHGGDAALVRRGDVALASCWSHVRRRFHELARAGASPVATDVLARIARPCAVEQEERGRTPDERRAARDGHGRPVIASLIETAKLNGVDPQAWLAAGHPATALDAPMPWNTPAAWPENVAHARSSLGVV